MCSEKGYKNDNLHIYSNTVDEYIIGATKKQNNYLFFLFRDRNIVLFSITSHLINQAFYSQNLIVRLNWGLN